MENVIVFENSIKKITINDEEGNFVTELMIDTADASTRSRFATLIKNLEHVSTEFEKEAEALESKNTENIVDKVVEESRIHVSYLSRCASELDALFGEGTVKRIYAKNYAMNSYFVPDEYQLLDFIDKVIPLMNKLFNERFERNHNKYNIGRRGKKA